MFDKINIYINEENKKEKLNNFIIKLFSNKYEIAFLTFTIYLT